MENNMSKKFEVTSNMLKRRTKFFKAIETELQRAYNKHGAPQWGRHEWYGITLEEFDEAFDDIRSNAPQEQLMAEVVQIAAMCVRYAETLDRYREPEE
jgi:hypothetical protein